MGSEMCIRDRSEDDPILCDPSEGNDQLLPGVIYKISSLSTEGEISWFLIHWADGGASNPDAWAITNSGSFEDIICGPTVGCTWIDPYVPSSFDDFCYTIQIGAATNTRIFMQEQGHGPLSCYQMQWLFPGLISSRTRHGSIENFQPKLVKVTIGSATSIGYAWELSLIHISEPTRPY